MLEIPMIVWGATREPSAAERDILEHAPGIETRIMSVSTLVSDIFSWLAQRPLIVIVSSRQDAATLLALGADEVLRLPAEGRLQEATLRAALQRVAARQRQRMRPSLDSAVRQYPGFTLLMRVVERHLGASLDGAASTCRELADELTRTMALADDLLQRAIGDEPCGCSKEMNACAQATRRTGGLISELQSEVERSDEVMRLLMDPSADASAFETNGETLLREIAEFLRDDIGDDITIDVETKGRCIVLVPRPAFLCIVCAAIENALENIRATKARGRIVLRATRRDREVVVEVADDGISGSSELRPSLVDALRGVPGRTMVRRLGEHVRALGGELALDADEDGTLLTMYLPVRQGSSLDVLPLTSPIGRRLH